MISDARNCIQLARVHAMYRWGWHEGLKYGALLGLLTGAAIPTAIYFLITRYSP